MTSGGSAGARRETRCDSEGAIMRHLIQIAKVCCAVLLSAMCIGSVCHAQSRPDIAIRIENASNKTFDNVLVKFPEQEENYGRVPSGSTSPYRTVTKAYRYAYVEIKVGDEVGLLLPFDYTGEPLVGPGRYTYRLTISRNSRSRNYRVELEFVVDK